MKKIFLVLLMLALVGNIFILTALPISADALEEAFETFSVELAPALPSAAVLGSNWSDAFIGQFLPAIPPHFGVGVFAGAAIFPSEAFNTILQVVDETASLPVELDSLGGLPLPTFGIDARMGGIFLPFDFGIKVALLPEDYVLGPATLNYKLIGADIRYALLKDRLLIPAVSIGVGYNYLSTDITVKDILGDNIVVQGVTFNSPDFVAQWETSVLDFKLQTSKSLLLVTPYAGLGLSYSTSTIGGGLAGGGFDKDEIPAEYATLFDGETGFTSSFEQTAWTTRIFGGTSFNLFILKLDVGAAYNLSNQSLSGQIGLRVQL